MMIWRVAQSDMATLGEIEAQWSIDDVFRANAILDMKADLEEAARQEAKRK